MYESLIKQYKIAVRFRGKSYQCDFRLNGKRKQVSRKTKDEALEAALEMLGVVLDEKPEAVQQEVKTVKVRTSGFTFADAYEKACKETWTTDRKDYKKSRRVGAAVVEFFGEDFPINRFTTDDVEDFKVFMQTVRNLSGATVNRHLSGLSVMIKAARSSGLADAVNPEIKWCKESGGRTRYFTDSEVKQMVAFMSESGRDEYADFIMVAIDTGCRTGELMKLEWRDVTDDYKSILLRDTKNGTHRRVPLLREASEILRKRSPHRQDTFVFSRMTQHKLSHHWKMMRKALGQMDDPEFVPHVMRHTCATRLASRNISEQKMMAWLGHKTPEMVKRYSHMNYEHLQDVVETMNAY